MPERKDGDRIIVTGDSGGSHFPKLEADTQYFWEADGTSSDGPFRIRDSVYGRKLRFTGPGEVGGVVVGRGDIILENHTDKPQRFLRGISAQGSLDTVKDPRKLEDTLINGLDKARYIIRGNVFAEDKIVLEDAIVFGNIQAKIIEVRHCIIIGAMGGEGTEKINVYASSILHYHAKQVTFYGPCNLLDAMGVSLEEPDATQSYEVGQTIYQSDLRYYPVFRKDTGFTLGNSSWKDESSWTSSYKKARIDPRADFKKVNGFRDFDGDINDENTEKHCYVFTLGGRILNFLPVSESIQAFRTMLKEGLEYEHYTPEYRALVKQKWKTSGVLTKDEQAIMHQITSQVQMSKSI
jgi:hypothetical protein